MVQSRKDAPFMAKPLYRSLALITESSNVITLYSPIFTVAGMPMRSLFSGSVTYTRTS